MRWGPAFQITAQIWPAACGCAVRTRLAPRVPQRVLLGYSQSTSHIPICFGSPQPLECAGLYLLGSSSSVLPSLPQPIVRETLIDHLVILTSAHRGRTVHHVLLHFILTHYSRYCFQSHFTDKKTKAGFLVVRRWGREVSGRGRICLLSVSCRVPAVNHCPVLAAVLPHPSLHQAWARAGECCSPWCPGTQSLWWR